MENTVFPISAIICFNSGSAGDFLLSLCGSQLNNKINFDLNSIGAVNIENQYFKETTKHIYYGQKKHTDLDFDQIRSVENTHYYLDFYPSIAKKIFYIDYPSSYELKILESVKKKRHSNSWSEFLEFNRNFLPEFAKNKVTLKDVPDVFVKRWNKNLTSWRANPVMQKINFLDFFDSKKTQAVVENIMDRPIVCQKDFNIMHQSWLEKNQDLFSENKFIT